MTETPGLRERLIAAKIAGGRTGQGYEFRSNENAADVACGVVASWLREQAFDRRLAAAAASDRTGETVLLVKAEAIGGLADMIEGAL